MRSSTELRRALRARRRTRGAAMLEAVIVVLFLVSVLLGLVFIAGLFETKLRAAHDARARNMENATNDCKREGSSLGSSVQAPPDGHRQGLEEGVRKLIDVQRFIAEGGGLSRVEVRQSFSFGKPDPAHPERKPPVSGSVSWRSSTACNPAVVGLNPLDLFDKLGIKDEVASAMSGSF
jgi:hypothetical protein